MTANWSVSAEFSLNAQPTEEAFSAAEHQNQWNDAPRCLQIGELETRVTWSGNDDDNSKQRAATQRAQRAHTRVGVPIEKENEEWAVHSTQADGSAGWQCFYVDDLLIASQAELF